MEKGGGTETSKNLLLLTTKQWLQYEVAKWWGSGCLYQEMMVPWLEAGIGWHLGSTK